MKVAVDTNILAYAEGVDDRARQKAADRILGRIGEDNIVLPAQALAELFNVLVKKAGRSRVSAGQIVTNWLEGYRVADTTGEALTDALALSALHQMQIFDAVIVATAAAAGCAFLLSEDMHDGFRWRGCTVIDPFASDLNPLFQTALASRPDQ